MALDTRNMSSEKSDESGNLKKFEFSAKFLFWVVLQGCSEPCLSNERRRRIMLWICFCIRVNTWNSSCLALCLSCKAGVLQVKLGISKVGCRYFKCHTSGGEWARTVMGRQALILSKKGQCHTQTHAVWVVSAVTLMQSTLYSPPVHASSSLSPG